MLTVPARADALSEEMPPNDLCPASGEVRVGSQLGTWHAPNWAEPNPDRDTLKFRESLVLNSVAWTPL